MQIRTCRFVSCAIMSFALVSAISAAEENCARDSALAFQKAFHEELGTMDARHFMQIFCQSADGTATGRSPLTANPVVYFGAEEESVTKACVLGDEQFFARRLQNHSWTFLPEEEAIRVGTICRNPGEAPLAIAFVAADAIQIALLYHPVDKDSFRVGTPAAKRWNPPNSVVAVDDSKLDSPANAGGTSANVGGGVSATYTRKPTARATLVFSVDTSRGPAKVVVLGDEVFGAKISPSGTADAFACYGEIKGAKKIRLNPDKADFRCSQDLAHMGDCTPEFLSGRCLVEYGRDLVVLSGTSRISYVKDKWDVVPGAGGWRCEKNGVALGPTLKFSQAANRESGSYLAKTYLCAGNLGRVADVK